MTKKVPKVLLSIALAGIKLKLLNDLDIDAEYQIIWGFYKGGRYAHRRRALFFIQANNMALFYVGENVCITTSKIFSMRLLKGVGRYQIITDLCGWGKTS